MGSEGRCPWSHEEDVLLIKHIQTHGEGKWSKVSGLTGLKRSAKSCRFRWTNHLRPDLNFSLFSSDEEDLIIRMHRLIGNRWALIAGRLPGRTASAVKNYWNTTLNKKIVDHHPHVRRHVVKSHCTHAARYSPSRHNRKMKGSNDSFLKNEGQSDKSPDGSHTLPGIGEANTKSIVNAETKSRVLPVDNTVASDQKCMILPDPGSLHAIINNTILLAEENFSKQNYFLSDDELGCMAACMPYIKEDEIDDSLCNVHAEEPFLFW